MKAEKQVLKIFSVALTEKMLTALDRQAEREGEVSRSAMIRRAVALYLREGVLIEAKEGASHE